MLNNAQIDFFEALKKGKRYDKIEFDKEWLKVDDFLNTIIAFLIKAEKGDPIATNPTFTKLFNNVVILEAVIRKLEIDLKLKNPKTKEKAKMLIEKLSKALNFIRMKDVFKEQVTPSSKDNYKEKLKESVHDIVQEILANKELSQNLLEKGNYIKKITNFRMDCTR